MSLGRLLALLPVLCLGVVACDPSTQQAPSSVWAWGWNEVGQIGDGTNGVGLDRAVPVRLALSDVWQIAAGNRSSLALKQDGTVWRWGSYTEAITNESSYSCPVGAQSFVLCDRNPTRVPRIGKAKGIGAGRDVGIAIMEADSTVCRWGGNTFGQLGDGTSLSVWNEVCTPLPDRVFAVDAGGGGQTPGGHVLALQSGPPQLRVWSWGHSNHDQTGLATCMFCPTARCGLSRCAATPAPMPAFNDVAEAAAGNEHSVAVKFDGTVWAWGSQDYGQLGVTPADVTGDVLTPLRVSTNLYRTEFLDHVSNVAAGGNHNLALELDRNPDGTVAGYGKVWAWGYNNFGQSGVAPPVRIQTFAREIPGLDHVTEIAAGDGFSLALKSDGTVWAWGRNDHGQLGAPSTGRCEAQQSPCSDVPIHVQNLANVTAIAAGGNHALAMTRP